MLPLKDYRAKGPCVLTLGFFDGVHLGHAALLERLARLAAERGLPSLVLTFDQRPERRRSPQLTTLERRCELIAATGPHTILVQEFTQEFAALSPEDFLREIVVGKLGADTVLAGYDCRFGRDAKGDWETLVKCAPALGYTCLQEPPTRKGGQIISTTLCRAALQKGDLAAAAELLGRPWALTGLVEHGNGLGHVLGYPTANLPCTGLALPPAGIYYAATGLGPALLYLGTRPTLTAGAQAVAETFLLDPPGAAPDLYGRPLSVAPQKYLGPERRYDSREELVAAIRQYVEQASRL